jgi:hypothetical protein
MPGSPGQCGFADVVPCLPAEAGTLSPGHLPKNIAVVGLEIDARYLGVLDSIGA